MKFLRPPHSSPFEPADHDGQNLAHAPGGAAGRSGNRDFDLRLLTVEIVKPGAYAPKPRPGPPRSFAF